MRAAFEARIVLTIILGQFYAVGQAADPYPNPAADPGHDLTTAEFFKDLGRNFKALPSTRNLLPALVGGAALGLATIPEQDLEQHFSSGTMWGGWAASGKYLGNPVILGGVSTALFAFSRKSQDRRFRSFSYALLQGSIMTTAVVQPMKLGFQRLRPNGENYSFPSGHSTDTFMYATVISEHYGWKAAIPAYAVASYVSMTRLADRKHHITDAVAGAGIGFLIGRTVSARMKLPSRVSMNVYRVRGGFAGVVRIGLR